MTGRRGLHLPDPGAAPETGGWMDETFFIRGGVSCFKGFRLVLNTLVNSANLKTVSGLSFFAKSANS